MKPDEVINFIASMRDMSEVKLTHTTRLNVIYDKLSQSSLNHIEYLQSKADVFYVHPDLKKEIIRNLDNNKSLYEQMTEALSSLTQDFIDEQKIMIPFLEICRAELENMTNETQ